MRNLRIAALVALVASVGGRAVSAQDLRGFVTGGITSEVTHQRLPSAGGGVLVNVGQPWLSAGAQAKTFWQWPYFAGRGTLFAQGNLITKGPVRPFVLGGVGFGESAGPMIGGGVELCPNERSGWIETQPRGLLVTHRRARLQLLRIAIVLRHEPAPGARIPRAPGDNASGRPVLKSP